MTEPLAIDPAWCARRASVWLDHGARVGADARRVGDLLDRLSIDDTTAPGFAEVGGTMLQSAVYLQLVARSAEDVDAALPPEALALIAYTDSPPTAPFTARAWSEAAADRHRDVAESAERLRVASAHPLGALVVDDLLTRIDPRLLDATLSALDDDDLGRVMHQIEPEGWLVSDERSNEVFAHLGERVSLETWRRMGQFTERINPDPKLGLPDTANAAPATAERFERLVDENMDNQTLYPPGETAPDPTAFRQGSIGDCYLIAALISLGLQDGGQLTELIVDNPNGTYTVTFADGSRQVVSPDLPVDPNSGEPAFAHSTDGSIFLGLVEKAYAQAGGGYGEIVGGRASEAVTDLTGRVGDWIDNDDISIADLAARFERGETLGLSTIDRPDGVDDATWRADPDTPVTFKDEFGGKYARLHQNHAFIVTSVDATTGTVGVKNPWDPSRPAFDLTEAQLRESVNGVYVNEAP